MPLDCPENTVAGIVAAKASGAVMVEMDVQWTKSHFPILMHDPTVDRTTNGTGRPRDLGLGDVTGLLAQDYAPWKTDPRFAAEHVPYAWNFMNQAHVSGIDVLLHVVQSDAPTADDWAKLDEYIDRTSMGEHTTIMGNEAVVRSALAALPQCRHMLIEYNPAASWRRGSSVRSIGVTDYAVPERDIDPGIVESWHLSGLTVWTWTTDSPALDVPANWGRVADAGVDRLITNRPAEALALFGT